MLMMSQMQRSPFNEDDLEWKKELRGKKLFFGWVFYCSVSVTVISIIIIIIIILYLD